MRIPGVWVFLGMLLGFATLCLGAGDFIWIEGEDAVEHNMREHNWYGNVTKETLSGNNWLSHYASGAPPIAEFRLGIAESGSYHFWIRANSAVGPRLSYKLDGSAWVEVDMGKAVEKINIASDGKPDMRYISWINAGQVRLTRGKHRIAFKFHSANSNHGGLDCFIFSQTPFMPRGFLKPGERTNKANPGFFAWEPGVDSFGPDALLDLSHLNEDVAGQDGRVAAEGNGFVLGSGKPVKFWAGNIGGLIHELDDASHVYLARHLAKRGVNLVRIHGGIYSSRDPAVDMEKLDKLHHFIWALKQEGIYAKVSFYFPAWFHLDAWHKEGNRWPLMLLFFEPDMQRVYFKWAEALLTTPNPYTGMPLGKDPAVAIVEIQNEDSHLFWTFDKKNAPPKRWETLKRLYGQWLKKKYGSLNKAIAAWGGKPNAGDDPGKGRMELFSAWNMTSDGIKLAPANRKRVSDQIRFLTENMRVFYQKTIRRFRSEYGYEGLVSCGNWRTADPGLLGPLERHCYTTGDVIDHHGYFDYNHKGEGSGWSVRPGHTFSSQSALNLSHANPLPYVEIEGYPNIISEIGWPMPNMYRAEWPFLMAAYGSLNGLDAICHFSIGSASWDQAVSKFPMSNPVVLGGFFATSLIYRNSYVAEAPSVVKENTAIEDLFALKGSKVFAQPAMDQMRADQVPSARRGRIKKAIDPAMFYAGRVTRSFQGRPQDSRVLDTSELINRKDKTIKSITGELRLDYGVGVATMNTPKAQGAVGFLRKKGTVRLDDVDIDMTNDYGTVLVVALDGRPIDVSKKILIQCMTIDQLYGWETSEPGGMGGTIRNAGSAPWGIKKIKATVTLRLKGPAPGKVIACDENGYPTDKKTPAAITAGAFTLQINETTPYTVVLR